VDKKEIAVSFLSLASSGRVGEAYEKYVHPDFRHHNPYFKGDRESLLKGMEESAHQFPHKEVRSNTSARRWGFGGRTRQGPIKARYALDCTHPYLSF